MRGKIARKAVLGRRTLGLAVIRLIAVWWDNTVTRAKEFQARKERCLSK